jgi:hypothetical protein
MWVVKLLPTELLVVAEPRAKIREESACEVTTTNREARQYEMITHITL